LFNSEIFKDYILLNILIKDESKPKSKQVLEKELEKAIYEENYELAKILNQEIKKLKDATN
jgi:protein-arginine kinase activator protein McsA